MARAQIETSFPPGTTSRYASSEYLGAYDEMNLDRSARNPATPNWTNGGSQNRAGDRPRSEVGPYMQQAGPSNGYLPPAAEIKRNSTQGTPYIPQRNTQTPQGPQAPPYGYSQQSRGSTPSTPSVHQQPHNQSYPNSRPPPPISRPHSLEQRKMSNDNGGRPANGAHQLGPRTPNQVRYTLPEERVYVPTTVAASNASTTGESRRRYDKLADVYSTSGDTVDFARNFGDYVTDRCPRAVWIGAVVTMMILGLLLCLFGAFNLPFCQVQPMIPVYLMVAGILILLSCSIRIYGLIPAPQNTRHRRIGGDICLHLFEAVFLLANIVWLILGCVWVYGSKRYAVFRQGIFEDHYCDPGLYWFAFAACSIQLILIVFGILLLIILVCLGAFKEEDHRDPLQDLPR